MISTFLIRHKAATAVALFAWALCAAGAGLAPSVARANTDYVPGEVVVGYAPGPSASLAAELGTRTELHIGGVPAPGPGPSTQILHLPPGVSVREAIARLTGERGIAYAVPNFIARAAGSWIPDDPGSSHWPTGWEALQWNFLPGAGVNAPQAWANLIAAGRPGGRGVVVAILDTGVAYRRWHQFRESPDFKGTRFVRPYDFVARNSYPLDRDGHGTFVAGTVAEATNNGVALTGLAYGAAIMPIRVLDSDGTGDAATISRAIRYAVTHGAQVINLSLEFSLDVTPRDIPDIISALGFAHRHGVVVVAAAGNDGADQLAYPAQASTVIAVGASTRDRCLADYSNASLRLDLVAPGGGDDSSFPVDPDCHPGRTLPPIRQITLLDPSHPARFGLPGDFYGTSMAAPHVSGTAALVIASGVLGKHPAPNRILARMEATAQRLGGAAASRYFGYGLLDAGAATER